MGIWYCTHRSTEPENQEIARTKAWPSANSRVGNNNINDTKSWDTSDSMDFSNGRDAGYSMDCFSNGRGGRQQ
jgi:hypothetical protein